MVKKTITPKKIICTTIAVQNNIKKIKRIKGGVFWLRLFYFQP